jgi:hypothetical protein
LVNYSDYVGWIYDFGEMEGKQVIVN